MALRMIHLIIVGALSLTVYVYTSYYSSSGSQVRQHVSSPFYILEKNVTSVSEIEPSKQTPNASASSVSVNAPVISSLPSSSGTSAPTPSANVTVKTPDLSKGVKTRVLYAAGHSTPRPEICPDLGSSLRLLTLIMSAPSHFNARMAIRQTWGHYASRKDVAIAFLLGTTTDQTLENDLANEGTLYGDIIRGRFFDSYNNLTLKTISMMEWVSDYCPKAKFVLKTDDDMFINIPKLLVFTDRNSNNKRVIFGRLAKRWKPIRNPKSKYYVSTSQYKAPVFPDFTTGPAYLLAASLASDLYKSSLDQTYLKLEDVFTTGVVAQKLKIKRAHAAEFLNKRVTMTACTVQKAISIHMVKFSEQFDLWKKLLDGKIKCK